MRLTDIQSTGLFLLDPQILISAMMLFPNKAIYLIAENQDFGLQFSGNTSQPPMGSPAAAHTSSSRARGQEPGEENSAKMMSGTQPTSQFTRSSTGHIFHKHTEPTEADHYDCPTAQYTPKTPQALDSYTATHKQR